MPTDKPTTFDEIARDVAERIEETEWCMCGDSKENHDQISNHTFVSMERHRLDEIEDERERCQAGKWNPNIDYEALILEEDELVFDD